MSIAQTRQLHGIPLQNCGGVSAPGAQSHKVGRYPNKRFEPVVLENSEKNHTHFRAGL